MLDAGLPTDGPLDHAQGSPPPPPSSWPPVAARRRQHQRSTSSTAPPFPHERHLSSALRHAAHQGRQFPFPRARRCRCRGGRRRPVPLCRRATAARHYLAASAAPALRRRPRAPHTPKAALQDGRLAARSPVAHVVCPGSAVVAALEPACSLPGLGCQPMMNVCSALNHTT